MGRYLENVPPPKDGKIYIPPKDNPSGGAGAAPTRTFTTHPTVETRTVTKRIVTETTIGPDGKKTTVTREIVTDGSGQELPSQFWTTNRIERITAKPTVTTTSKTEQKAAKPQKMKDFIDEVVKMHNKYRKVHGKVGDIKHNKDISVLAQSWAEKLAADGRLAHSNARYKGEELGENVASKWSSGGSDYTAEDLVNQWYSENSKYDWGGGNFQQVTGHFSQVVWKASKEVGIGKAFGKDGRVFVVANYHPAGNILGQFRENVFPAK